MSSLQSKEEKIHDEIELFADTVNHSPTPSSIKETAEEVVKRFTKPRVSARKRAVMRETNNDYEAMTWDDKRALVELVFNGTAPDGRPMGIYVETIDRQEQFRKKQFALTLRGIAPVGEIEGVTQCAWGSPGRAPRARRSCRPPPRPAA